jgi:cell wall assembly regulator SMI1
LNTEAIWKHFEDALLRFAPDDYAGLLPSASDAEIAQAEKAMKVKFPAQLRAAYRRHNGVSPALLNGRESRGLFHSGYRWCSLPEMVAKWQLVTEYAEGAEMDDHDFTLFPVRSPKWDDLAIRPELWNKKWIPIGVSNSMGAYCVDLVPCARGTKGQVIKDSGELGATLIAPSLNAWIEFVTQSLVSGRFKPDPETGEWIDTLWGPRTRMSYSYYGWNSSGAVGEGPPELPFGPGSKPN